MFWKWGTWLKRRVYCIAWIFRGVVVGDGELEREKAESGQKDGAFLTTSPLTIGEVQVQREWVFQVHRVS